MATVERSSIEQSVRRIVAQILNEEPTSCRIDEYTFDLESRIELDLGSDGLDVTMILCLLEQEHDIALSDVFSGQLTARDLILAIEKQLDA